MARTKLNRRDEFLARAAECRAKAEDAMSEAARNRYLDSADRWTMLAMSFEEAPSLAPDMGDAFHFHADHHVSA